MEFKIELFEKQNETKEQQRHRLYLKQKALLDLFLEKKAISRAQYEKSLHDMTEKMGEKKDPPVQSSESAKQK